MPEVSGRSPSRIREAAAVDDVHDVASRPAGDIGHEPDAQPAIELAGDMGGVVVEDPSGAVRLDDDVAATPDAPGMDLS
jgi:hypothetical protein